MALIGPYLYSVSPLHLPMALEKSMDFYMGGVHFLCKRLLHWVFRWFGYFPSGSVRVCAFSLWFDMTVHSIVVESETRTRGKMKPH